MRHLGSKFDLLQNRSWLLSDDSDSMARKSSLLLERVEEDAITG